MQDSWFLIVLSGPASVLDVPLVMVTEGLTCHVGKAENDYIKMYRWQFKTPLID